MKKITTIGKVALFSLAMAFVSSCNGDDNGSGSGGGSGSYITAKIDGNGFSSKVSGVQTVVAIHTGSGDGTLYQVSGGDSGANAISIVLYGITATGTYDVNPDSNSVLAYTTNSSHSYDTGECSGATGTVTVTAITDTKIEGTFEFTGKSEETGCDSKSVTTGKFRGVFNN